MEIKNFSETSALKNAGPLAPVHSFVTAQAIDLENFRNYTSLNLKLAPGFTILTGLNAQGKTNLIEAIYLASTGRLLRGKREQEAIRHGCKTASVRVILSPHDSEIRIDLELGARKKAFLNGVPLARSADLLGRLATVTISTEDLLLTRGEPSDRRLFLDLQLSSLYPSYLRHLATYKRSLEQRNALLKQWDYQAQNDQTISVWDEKLSEHGSAIREARFRYVHELNSEAQKFHALMGNGERLTLTYTYKDEAEHREDLLAHLEASRFEDIRRGSTSIGPHRDDMQIEVENQDCRLFGSQGQQRTASISIKLAAFDVAKTILGHSPLLLLDDMFSDLDDTRQAALSSVVLNEANQAILTCTDPASAGKSILGQAQIFEVKAGRVSTV